MTATLMDGKALAKKTTDDIKSSIANMNKKPSLAVVLVGEDPASQIYVRSKKKKAIEIGMNSEIHELPADIQEEELLSIINDLNNNSDINGILIQLPLPEHMNEQTVIQSIAPEKDVDGFTYANVAKLVLNYGGGIAPCTPQGIILLLKEYIKDLSGMDVCIVGRSNIVGRPLSVLLLQEDCSVNICHSKTKDLKSHCLRADILISCVGQENLITEDMVKDGAIVVDIGINRKAEGKKICGDVDFDAVSQKASFITPVPGGVGPMTIACLLKNTFEAFKEQN